mgnify:FL=1
MCFITFAITKRICSHFRCQLALEFSGKATKLYQKHYGDEHASTQRCLDLFTSVYAEVGREEYTSKLTQFESEGYQAVDADNQQAVKGMGESYAVVVQVLLTVSSTISDD